MSLVICCNFSVIVIQVLYNLLIELQALIVFQRVCFNFGWFFPAVGRISQLGRMAFMGEDSWKAGLTGHQMAKVTDLESKVSHMTKEKSQRTMQMETLEQALDKQKRKVIERN